jgi:2-keto-4-pentenoate hydratase/2-oxohepta-3-ene-1,7-dioic acid hydratase in catechol pathway
MQLVRAQVGESVRFGILAAGEIRLLSGDPFAATDIGELATRERLPAGQYRLLAPVAPGKVFGVGGNYLAHAREVGLTSSTVPAIFMKPPQAVIGPGAPVVLPEVSARVEHEGELAVVIGRQARHVARADAASVVLGLTIANDVTARDLQRSDPEVTRAKGFDTFCPLGPHIETDVGIGAGLELTCRVNGELRQVGNTADFVFDISTLIEFLSSWTTLLPGDVILTGSPAGTGPLAAGDEVAISVAGVGELRHSVVAEGAEGQRRQPAPRQTVHRQ